MSFLDKLAMQKTPVPSEPATTPAQYTPPDSLKYVQPTNNATPDWEDLRQEYPKHVTINDVPVKVNKPIKVWNLPAKRSVVRSFTIPAIGATPAVPPLEIIPADPRIKKAFIQSSSTNPGAIYLGTLEQVNATMNGHGDAYFYPGSAPLGPWEGFDQGMYAIAVIGSSANVISVRIEYWAD